MYTIRKHVTLLVRGWRKLVSTQGQTLCLGHSHPRCCKGVLRWADKVVELKNSPQVVQLAEAPDEVV